MAWVSVWMSCSRKSEGTVWTEGRSTSTRDAVEADSLGIISSTGGAAAWDVLERVHAKVRSECGNVHGRGN